jgi:hypothetical protein
MAATFRAQTEAELRAALASKCNLILEPLARQACLAVAQSGQITTNPPKPAIPTWAIALAAGGVAYVLWKTWR